MLRGGKVMESKAPNLEGLLQPPDEVLYLYLAPLMATRRRERCKDEDRALLGNEERYSSSRVCGFKSVWIEPKRCI
jgi:hypothetical protein